MTVSWWLRLKATLERTQRLAHSYTEQLLAVYPDRVQALGKGLAMDEERLKVSAESSGPRRGQGTEGGAGWGGRGGEGDRWGCRLQSCICQHSEASSPCQLFRKQRPSASKEPLVID